MIQQSLSQQYIRELFHYSVITGQFTRIKARQGKNGHVGAIAGTVNHYGYRIININGSLHASHRLAWLYITGEYPDHHIDHHDQNKDNNAWHNLGPADYGVNARNMPRRKDNKSGQVGVSWSKQRGMWFVRISTSEGNKFLGYRDHLFEAICLRKSSELKYGYHKNHGG